MSSDKRTTEISQNHRVSTNRKRHKPQSPMCQFSVSKVETENVTPVSLFNSTVQARRFYNTVAFQMHTTTYKQVATTTEDDKGRFIVGMCHPVKLV